MMTLLGSAIISLAQVREGFVYVKAVNSTIEAELRYFSSNNFIGDTINGYEAPVLILTNEAAQALSQVQDQLHAQGLGLKVFDGYRPQRAVDQFVGWAKELSDTTMKAKYYPKVAKDELFEKGYIASRSGHTRGSTMDLTLIWLSTGAELDMGSPYDLFDPVSHHGTKNSISSEQIANRLLLKEAMETVGFKSYQYEWWHYTLKNEPFPDTYFDFVIR